MVSPEVVIVTEWTLVALAYIFLGLRLAVRIKQRQTNLIWSEVWLVLGALWLLGLVICDTLTYHAGAMSEFVVTTVEIMKIRFATNYLFDAGLYFPKLSMLTMYLHILPRYERLHRLALYFAGVFTVVSFLITVFMDTFLCGPDPSVNWSMDPGSCMVFSSELLFRLNWSLCFTTEAMLFILPLPILRTLRTAKCRELAVLSFLFSLGIITLSVSAGRFATMLTLGNDISLYIWATAEFSISQIIVSSMALRPLMQRAWRVVSASNCVGGDGDDVSDSEARRGLSVDVAPPGRRGAPGTGPRRNTSPSCGKRAPNPWSGLTETDIELGEIRDGDCDYQYGADGDSSPQHDDGGAGGERNRSKRNDSGVADLTRSCTSSQHVESERISNVNMIDKGPGL